MPQASTNAAALVAEDRRAMVLIQPPQPVIPAPGQVLPGACGISVAELRVLMQLMEGGTRETIAGDLGVAVATVKTHMQSLFEKTGTNRQVDLVRTVMQAMGGPHTSG